MEYSESEMSALRGKRIAMVFQNPAYSLNPILTIGDQLGEIYAWHEKETPGGLAVIVAEPRKLTVVNVVGKIDLNMLTKLAGQFGIPALPGMPGVQPAR